MSGITPKQRALLDAIRHGEGTTDGYDIMFGGGRFNPAQGHPRKVVNSGRYSSDAAGAYQFLSTTWDEWAPKAGVDPKDFSPAAQDKVALALVRRRGVTDEEIEAGFTPELVDKLAPEWASLPTKAGKSYYGQPVKGFADLQKVYNTSLGQGGATAQPAAAASAPATGGGGAAIGSGSAQGAIAGLQELVASQGRLLGGLSTLAGSDVPRRSRNQGMGLGLDMGPDSGVRKAGSSGFMDRVNEAARHMINSIGGLIS